MDPIISHGNTPIGNKIQVATWKLTTSTHAANLVLLQHNSATMVQSRWASAQTALAMAFPGPARSDPRQRFCNEKDRKFDRFAGFGLPLLLGLLTPERSLLDCLGYA